MRGLDDTAADVTDAARPLTAAGRLAVTEFVPLAIDLARALDEWHGRQGPHGGLCPDTVRLDANGGIHLQGRSSRSAPAAYAAPEQDGRLGRAVDERTDLYVLGVLYYQLLSGRLPFPAVTTAQWRRCHLSQPPTPLADLVAGLPPALHEIVALLLEKSPHDRYQTARGLAIDLERCRDALAGGDRATPLLLRTRDLPDRLTLGGRLYGRERQLGRLQAAYDRVAGGGPAELVAVTAETGLGKWATVAHFADSVVTGGGLTLRAACGRDDAGPYAVLGRLLADLAAYLADAPAEQRTRIADAVGACGGTLVELVPALRGVFGCRPPPDGPTAAAGHRMHLAARRLLSAVSAPGRPLVIAIRDVQWADELTVEMLRYVLAVPDAPAVLAVVTYRAADVGPGHPLQALLSDGRVTSATLPLRPLPDSALAELLGDTLGAGKRDSSRLSRTVASRTGSNPLLVENFLHGLADRDLLTYTDDDAAWQWQQRRVDEEPEVADLTALIAARLERFDADTRETLELAATFGPHFDAATLAVAASHSRASSPAEIAARLRPAVRAELVTAGPAPGEYRWRHEQLRQATLARVGDPTLARLRLAVGRALTPHPDRLFEAVTHLNATAELLPAADERGLAELNLAAGTRANRVGAGATARGYFTAGLGLLGPDAWRESPDLALRLYVASAEAEQDADRPEEAELLLERAARHLAGDFDRVRLLGAQAMLRQRAGDDTGALRIGIEALRLLALPIPADPARWPAAATEATERMRHELDEGVLDKLASRPECAEPRVVLATNLISDLARPIWPDGSGRDLLTAIGVELAIEHGPTAATGFTLARLAMVFARHRHDREASRLAEAGRRLLDRPGARHPAVTRTVAAVLGRCWLHDLTPMIRELYAAYRTAVEEGEVRLAQRLGAVYAVHRFAMGMPLDQMAADIEARWRFARRHGVDERAAAVMRLLDKAVSRLRGRPGDPAPPTAQEEEAQQRILRGEYGHYSIVGLSPLLAPAHVFDDAADLAGISHLIGQVVARAPVTFLTAETAFWHAFSLIGRYETASPEERESLSADLVTLQDKLDDLATRGPGMLRARALLLSAERARLAGATEQARIGYDRAIAAARECDFVRTEAFAAERGGLHALARGEAGDAVAYLRRARTCYQQWGAEAKLDQLDELLAAATLPAGAARPLDQLDLLTVVQAFQSISSELRLDRLVGVLLELLVQHSQAERGYLLLANGKGLAPVAEAVVERDRIRVNTRVGGPLPDQVPLQVVAHAGRHRKVIAGGPDELAAFAADPYLASVRPRSVLCAPIVRRDNLLAVLYLEHRRLDAAFSSSYRHLLDLLCTQAAIALENATVHARLMEANRILDATFDRMPVGLVLLGPDLTVRRASPQAVEIMGLPIAPGTPLVDLFDVLTPTDMTGQAYRYEPGFEAVSDWVDPINREIVILTPGGERLRLSTSAIPLRDEAGALVGVTFLVSLAR
ncbi:MAG TPA: AAA family ATPase [Planosporangium sp.]|nr:AAA family ATPase [Planosporangium sp.]